MNVPSSTTQIAPDLVGLIKIRPTNKAHTSLSGHRPVTDAKIQLKQIDADGLYVATADRLKLTNDNLHRLTLCLGPFHVSVKSASMQG